MSRTRAQEAQPRPSLGSHISDPVRTTESSGNSGPTVTRGSPRRRRHLRTRDREDWMFDPVEMVRYAAFYGPFTVDACADSEGRNAQADKFYHNQNSFLKANVEGENVWLNAPFRRAGSFIRHYLECKERAPAQTSAVIILPKWTNKSWWKLTEGFRVLKTYPAGTNLFTAPSPQHDGTRVDMGPTRWETVVFWDPPTLQGGIKELPVSTTATVRTTTNESSAS